VVRGCEEHSREEGGRMGDGGDGGGGGDGHEEESREKINTHMCRVRTLILIIV